MTETVSRSDEGQELLTRGTSAGNQGVYIDSEDWGAELVVELVAELGSEVVEDEPVWRFGGGTVTTVVTWVAEFAFDLPFTSASYFLT